MSNRSATYTLYLNSNVKASLIDTEGAALRLDGAMWNLNKTLSAFGLGLGAHFLIDGAKDWVQGAADFETATIRIKNSSENISQASKNTRFISEEVDKFKLKVQDATEDYGKFLAMLSGSGMASDQVRKLHDNFLLVNKVQGLSNSEISKSIYDLGVLLTESRPDAMHLRGLTVNLHGYKHFLAQALGKPDEYIGEIIHSKRTGDIPKEAFIEAIDLMAQSKRAGLPEALNSLQSSLNELDTAWTRFKNTLVIDLKPELVGFFHTLEDGVHWLKENEDRIIGVGKVIYDLVKLYAEYRVGMFAINGITFLWNMALGAQVSTTIRQTTATTALNSEMMMLNANLEAQIFLLDQIAFKTNVYAEEQALLGISMATRNAANLPINMNGISNTSGALGGLGAAFSKAMIPVFIAGMAIEVANMMYPENKATRESMGWTQGLNSFLSFGFDFWGNGENIQEYAAKIGLNKLFQSELSKTTDKSYGGYDLLTGKNEQIGKYKYLDSGNELYNYLSAFQNSVLNKKILPQGGNYNLLDIIDPTDEYGKRKTDNASLVSLLKQHGFSINTTLKHPGEDDLASDGAKGHKINAPDIKNHIRGNSVTNINIEINELNGLKSCTFTVKSMTDYNEIKELIGDEVVRLVTDAVNDAQQVGKHH